MTKELGKIKRAVFGRGGYQDVQFGLTLDLGGEAWGVGHFVTELEKVGCILAAAKVKTVDQLVGKPVEVTFNGQVFESMRVLTEVL